MLVIETPELPRSEMAGVYETTQSFGVSQNQKKNKSHRFGWLLSLRQFLRFGLVGGVNTLIDLVILNGLLLLFPTTSSLMLLVYNSVAYSLGALNSFFFNKYWTFHQKQKTTRRELARFTITTLCGIAWSNVILWFASTMLHPQLINATLWANASKFIAIVGTVLISYLGMRLWVFVRTSQKGHTTMLQNSVSAEKQPLSTVQTSDVSFEMYNGDKKVTQPLSRHSLSVVLPAHNEEHIIASTIFTVCDMLSHWQLDFEVLVVNDGSTDRTGAIVTDLMAMYPQLRLITHSTNQGYGAALMSGFTAATKELTFFMDSDGQFDIRDLSQFFPLIEKYHAVLGYRIDRKDSWLRKLNAWGWKMLIGGVLGVHVRDVDCAFKLLPTEFFQWYPLEARGAMINAELLYKLTAAGYTYCEVGVHHLPRLAGRATGAKLSVIARAFRELFANARKWQHDYPNIKTQPLRTASYSHNKSF